MSVFDDLSKEWDSDAARYTDYFKYGKLPFSWDVKWYLSETDMNHFARLHEAILKWRLFATNGEQLKLIGAILTELEDVVDGRGTSGDFRFLSIDSQSGDQRLGYHIQTSADYVSLGAHEWDVGKTQNRPYGEPIYLNRSGAYGERWEGEDENDTFANAVNTWIEGSAFANHDPSQILVGNWWKSKP